ncbi:autotransporter domain-containing protein [Anaerobiospirillum succiniciproducens]|uniref:autotransporter domain-containing protein n=1 Tax=Anaerobiospirillum succiniciproducens TaxID=13335 RepID=UPI0004042913|nr:autotransporter outer membrane beta-barrel domain-containing protein [Anaerobiospirillum succiniciproducens]
MKQTNNAIKFLMAQYRAIFKNANIAMVAAMAAAALAAGSANAAQSLDGKWDLTDFTNSADNTLKAETINKESALDLSKLKDTDVTNSGFTFSGKDANTKIDGAKVSITGSKDKHLAVKGLALSNGAELSISNSKEANSTIFGFNGADPKGKDGVMTVDGSKVTATNAGFAFNNVVISNQSEITLGGMIPEGGVSGTPNWVVYSNIGANKNDGNDANNGVLSVSNSTINLKDKSDIMADVEVVLDGATINFNGTDDSNNKHATAFVRASTAASDAGKVTVKGATVLGGSGDGAIFADKIDIQKASATIAESKKLTLDGDWEDKTAPNVTKHKKSTITIKDFTTAGKGTLVIGNDGKGGDVTVSGNTEIGSAVDNYAALTVSGAGVLTVKSALLADDTGLFKKGTTNSGSVTLAKGGTLAISDATDAKKPFDLGSLSFAETAAGNTIAIGADDTGVITGENLAITKKLDNATGLTVKATNLTLGKSDFEHTKNALGVESLNSKNVTFVKSGTGFTLQDVLNLTSTDSGSITGSDLNVSGGVINIKAGIYTLDKALTITSTTAKDKVALNVEDGAKLVVSGGKLATVNAANGKINVAGGVLDASKASDYELKSGTITLSNAAELHLDDSKVLSGGTALSGDKFAGGSVVSDASSKIVFTDVSMTKEQFHTLVTTSKFAGIFDGVTLTGYDVSGKQNISNIQSNFAQGHDDVQALVSGNSVNGNYSVGNAQLKDEGTSLELGASGNLTLVNANAADCNGKFVSDKHGNVAGVTMTGDNTLTLAGDGAIGKITGSAGQGTVIVGTASKPSNVSVEGSIGADGAQLAQVNTNGANVTVAGDVYVNNVAINDGSLTLADGKKIVLGNTTDILDSSFAGNVTADSLTLKSATGGNLIISDDATVKINALNAAGVTIQVGQDGTDTSSGTLETGKLDLAGGALIVDPEFSEDAAIAAVKNLSQQDQDTGAEVLNGKVAVGKNAAVGIGFGSRAEVESLLSTYGYMVGGKFDKTSDLHGALVLNAPLKISTGNGVLIDTTNTAITVGAVGTNEFKMGANSGLVITDGAYSVDADGKKTGAAVTLESGGQNSVKIDGGKVILAGNFTAADSGIQLFSGTATNLVSGTGIKLESANGLIEAEIGADGKVKQDTWVFDKDNKLGTYYSDASQPVRDLLKSVMKGEITGNAVGNKFLGTVANSKDKSGVLADAAAHAATYAGAQQAAVASVTTMADAMFGRVGAVGVEAASISATGSQANGGVWLTPMYKSVDADSFNAEGASYGSEVDLGGVAFGADTVNGNMRFGAVFNIGSGDAEGKGNGNGLKDEFDYYGFGIYTAMGFGNFALVGDASMTVISHDVEGHGLKGKADTTAVTMGVTGQYSIATPVVDVTPHLGARFIRLNTDSYDLMSADGVLATTDFDVQNVFSVPLGVTLSKGFVAGGWTLAPSADLTIAFNTGDTDAKSKTTFTGVPSIDLTTEVLDEVTYGVSLGLGAQNGAFGTSFGINYTGSSNTDSFGVNAQARYMF